VLVGNRGGGLHALSLKDGALLWRLGFWGSWVEATPVVVDGVIYIGSSDLRRISAIDPADGRVIWRSDVYGWSWGTPAVDGDRLYVGVAGGAPYFVRHVASLTALDRTSGAMLWRYPLPEGPGAHQWGIAGSPVVAGDLLVVATMDGSLYGFPLR
jgi:outer membrane protein assembly factor BamB